MNRFFKRTVIWNFKNLKEGKNLNIAPMGTASFFVIAIVNKFNRLLHVVRNDKKDIVDSGL